MRPGIETTTYRADSDALTARPPDGILIIENSLKITAERFIKNKPDVNQTPKIQEMLFVRKLYTHMGKATQ